MDFNKDEKKEFKLDENNIERCIDSDTGELVPDLSLPFVGPHPKPKN